MGVFSRRRQECEKHPHAKNSTFTVFQSFITKSQVQKFPIFMPGNGIQGVSIVHALSVSLWQKKFNLDHNFWTAGDRVFIFGTHAKVMIPFQMTIESITLTFILKTANLDCCRQGHLCFTKISCFAEPLHEQYFSYVPSIWYRCRTYVTVKSCFTVPRLPLVSKGKGIYISCYTPLHSWIWLPTLTHIEHLWLLF